MSSKQPQVTAKLGLDNSSMRSSLDRSRRDVGGFAKYAKSSLSTAFKGASIAAGGFVAALGYGLKKNVEIENTEIALKSFMGSAEKAREAVAMLRKEASDRPIFSTSEIMETGKALSTLAGGDVNKLKGLVQLTEKLSLLNPNEGLVGASFSLKEMSSWDYTSIVERFNLSKKRLQELKALGMEGTQAVAKILTEMGISDATLDDFGNSFSGMVATIKSNVESFAVEMSKGLFDDLKPKLEELKGFLTEHKTAIQEIASGIATAVSGILQTGVKATEVAGVTASGAGAAFQSYKDDFQSGRMDFGKAAKGFFGSIGAGLGAGAAKVNEGLWRLGGRIWDPVNGSAWATERAEDSRRMAAQAWAQTKVYDDMVNDGLGIDRANAAADDARAAKAEEYLGPKAQLGPGVTNRQQKPQQANVQIGVASNAAVSPVTAGSV